MACRAWHLRLLLPRLLSVHVVDACLPVQACLAVQKAVLFDGAAATLSAVAEGALPALPGYAAVVRVLWRCDVWDLLRHWVLAPDGGHADVGRFAGLRERIVAAVEVFALLRAGESLARCFWR